MTIYIAQYWADVFCKQFTHKDGKIRPTNQVDRAFETRKPNPKHKMIASLIGYIRYIPALVWPTFGTPNWWYYTNLKPYIVSFGVQVGQSKGGATGPTKIWVKRIVRPPKTPTSMQARVSFCNHFKSMSCTTDPEYWQLKVIFRRVPTTPTNQPNQPTKPTNQSRTN